MKILITGANGFVGSHVLEASRQYESIHWVAACRDRRKLLPGSDAEVREGDLRDAEYRLALLDGVDVVIHTAAWTSLWSHRDESARLFLEPTLQLLEDAVSRGVARFVFLSTTSAADPRRRSHDGAGIQPVFWPHLANVVRIENRMRELAADTTAMISLRCGLFAGERYNLGLLPILLPRLKTHLVPWIQGGRTSMPIVAGPDLGQAFVRAATAPGLEGYRQFQVVGPEVPSVREVVEYLHAAFGFPKPHYSVPFPVGYAFARLMEWLDPLVPWEPLVVRSIIHLLEETSPDNAAATRCFGYHPQVHWKTAIASQLAEMQTRQRRPMKMAVPPG